MPSIDNIRIQPITRTGYNRDKPKEETIGGQESYYAYIKRKYRETEEDNANIYIQK